MECLDSYKVNLKDVEADTVSYRWHADDDFFSAVQGLEIQRGSIDVALRVKRTSGAFLLSFELEGTVEVPCDRCLEPMDQPIHTAQTLRVTLGESYEDDGELITVPEDDGTFSAAWHIYEIAALAIPLRHVHEDGCCACPMEDISQESAPSEEQPTDPRWDALKKLINK